MAGEQPVTRAAKLAVPVLRRETVVRERLLRALDAATERPLTVVAAPAGYGKTTALVQWLDAAAPLHGWVSLDPGDNDPRRLVAHVLAAAARALPEPLGPAQRAFAGGSDLEATVLPLLAGALAAGDDGQPRLVLVLDDYHAIDAEPCHAFVRGLVEAAPPRLALVLATRTPPPLGLGPAAPAPDLGPEILRFRGEEAERLLNGSLALGLDDLQLAAIGDRVRGWAAGLVLTAAALDAGGEHATVIDALTRSRAGLEAYVVEEVLAGLRPELRDFLLRTSVLDRLSAPLCARVADEPRAEELLGEIRALNLFVTELGARGEWLRYHDVFAEALGAELHRREPGRVGELHERASAWFEEAGMPEDAIEHAIRGRAGARAAQLLAQSWVTLFAERRVATVRGFLDRLPRERGALGPFCEALDVSCTVFEGVDQRATAERARTLLDAHREDEAVRLLCEVLLVSPFHGDVGAAAALGRDAWRRAEGAPVLRAQLLAPLALTLWFAGDDAAVRRLLEPALSAGAEQATMPRVWARGILALLAAEEGRAAVAEVFAREATAIVDAAGARTAVEFTALPLVLAEALRAGKQLGEAREHMDRGLAAEGRRPGSVGQAMALVFDARLALAEGDRDRAATSARHARRVAGGFRDLGRLERMLGEVEAELGAGERDPLVGTPLSVAEQRVLGLLTTALPLRAIAHELDLAESAVEDHVRRLYQRLDVASRAEAVAVARALGLLPAG